MGEKGEVCTHGVHERSKHTRALCGVAPRPTSSIEFLDRLSARSAYAPYDPLVDQALHRRRPLPAAPSPHRVRPLHLGRLRPPPQHQGHLPQGVGKHGRLVVLLLLPFPLLLLRPQRARGPLSLLGDTTSFLISIAHFPPFPPPPDPRPLHRHSRRRRPQLKQLLLPPLRRARARRLPGPDLLQPRPPHVSPRPHTPRRGLGRRQRVAEHPQLLPWVHPRRQQRGQGRQPRAARLEGAAAAAAAEEAAEAVGQGRVGPVGVGGEGRGRVGGGVEFEEGRVGQEEEEEVGRCGPGEEAQGEGGQWEEGEGGLWCGQAEAEEGDGGERVPPAA